MDTITKFFEDHSAATHVLAVVGAFLFGAYFQVPAFHDLVTHYYGLLPQTLKEFVATGVALFMWYRQSNQPTTKA